jgi:hypothetical protein
MKKFFLVALLVVSASIAVAQDKYEFMTIVYESASNRINISINGIEFSNGKIELPKEKNEITNTNLY